MDTQLQKNLPQEHERLVVEKWGAGRYGNRQTARKVQETVKNDTMSSLSEGSRNVGANRNGNCHDALNGQEEDEKVEREAHPNEEPATKDAKTPLLKAHKAVAKARNALAALNEAKPDPWRYNACQKLISNIMTVLGAWR